MVVNTHDGDDDAGDDDYVMCCDGVSDCGRMTNVLRRAFSLPLFGQHRVQFVGERDDLKTSASDFASTTQNTRTYTTLPT